MLRATLRFQLSLAILAFFSCATVPICQGEDVTAEQDPCVSSSKDYRPTDEEIGDDEDRYFALRDIYIDFTYSSDERDVQELGPDSRPYLLDHVNHSDARARGNAIYMLKAAGVDPVKAHAIYREHLDDPCRYVQGIAAMRLIGDGIHTPEVISALVRNVDHECNDIAGTLRDLHDIAVRPIATFMADPTQSTELRRKAAGCFPYWVDPDNPSLRPLYEALDSDDLSSRALAALALADFHSSGSSELNAELAEKFASVLAESVAAKSDLAEEAIDAIWRLEPEPSADVVNPALMSWITTPGQTEIKEAVRALRIESEEASEMATLADLVERDIHADTILEFLSMRPYAISPPLRLREIVKQRIVEQREAKMCAQVLYRMGEPGADDLLAIGRNPEVSLETRVLCILQTGRIDDQDREVPVVSEELTQQLCLLLKDKEPGIAQAAAISLTHMGNTTVDVTPILATAWSDSATSSIFKELRYTIPHDPNHLANLMEEITLIYPTLKRNGNLPEVIEFLAIYGVNDPAVQQVIDDAIINHLDKDDLGTLNFPSFSESLATRIESEIPRLSGAKLQKVLRELYYLAKEANHEAFDPSLQIPPHPHYAQAPPAGLVKALDSTDVKVRQWAAVLYSYYSPKDPKVIRLMFDMMKEEDAKERNTDLGFVFAASRRLTNSGEALEQLLPQMIESLDQIDDYPDAELWITLGPKSSPALDKFIELLADEHRYEFACKVLGAIGPDAISAAPHILEHRQPHHDLLLVARTLRQIEADSSVLLPEIDRRLADPFRQSDTLQDLWQMGPSDAVTDRYIAVFEGENWEMKLRALDVLRRHDLKDPQRIVPVLIEATKSKSVGFRRAAVQALGTQTGLASQAVPVLMDLMHNDVEVRSSAIRSLGAQGKEAAVAVPELLQMVEQSSDNTDAMIALGNIGKPAEAAIPKIIEYLSDKELREPDPSRMFTTLDSLVEALGGFGPAAHEALPLLLEVYRDDRHDFFRKRSVAQSIYQISPGFGAVNGIPQPPEPPPGMLQFSW